MVKVTIGNFGFTATGHADYDVEGKDIVCSAISALTQTIAMSLQKFCHGNVEIYKGDVYVHLLYPNEKSNLLLYTLSMGLGQIKEEYPDNIDLEVNMV